MRNPMSRNLKNLVARLESNPSVVGIVRYGRRPLTDASPGGDFDLFVFVKERPPDIESIHFYVGDIPVDLSLRSLDDLRSDEPLTAFDTVLVDAEILHDETGILAQEMASLGERWLLTSGDLTEHEVHMSRFCQQHVLDKVRGRITDEPLLCEFLLATNIYWLVRTYFRVRCIPYLGEKDALEWLEVNDPEVYADMQRFYASHDLNEKLDVNERLTEAVLAPIGGPWRREELLVFGTHTDVTRLQSKGQKVFSELFGSTVEEVQALGPKDRR